MIQNNEFNYNVLKHSRDLVYEGGGTIRSERRIDINIVSYYEKMCSAKLHL